MDHITVETSEEQDTTSQVWNRLMGAALAVPGAKVNRTKFLSAQLSSHCGEEQVREAIASRPANAGVPPETIERLANGCIKLHLIKASAISFATGLPGGWAIAGSIPVDLVNFYGNAIILSQKLAYLYGWPDDFLHNDEGDDETKVWITMLIGAMLGASQANRAISEVARRSAKQVVRRLPRIALSKTVSYPIVKQIARWIGVQVTKTTFARGVSRIIPIVGGVASATVTVFLMRRMAKRLITHLKGLRLASPDEENSSTLGTR